MAECSPLALAFYVPLQVKQWSSVESEFWQWKKIPVWLVTAFQHVSVETGYQMKSGAWEIVQVYFVSSEHCQLQKK